MTEGLSAETLRRFSNVNFHNKKRTGLTWAGVDPLQEGRRRRVEGQLLGRVGAAEVPGLGHRRRRRRRRQELRAEEE